MACIINIKSIFIFFIDNILILLLSILCYKKFKSTYYSNKILKTVLICIILLANILTIRGQINEIYASKSYNKSLIVEKMHQFIIIIMKMQKTIFLVCF